ncbi:MAG: peptidoglycan DD-metalloendopeptidase family protein [Bacteroidales bacterium]|nr:peptidoglycan DD-metalloendopeptidase family protein [Bacteroidales bacterium]
MEKSQKIREVLEKHRDAIAPLMRLGVSQQDVIELDFTRNNEALNNLDISDTSRFIRFMDTWLDHYTKVGIGGYGEDRFIYQRSPLFDGEDESRSIHLGIDVWVPAGTKIYTPLDAVVHSFDYNDNYGDYGATIILEHQLEGERFYTLYGHLSASSLKGLEKDQTIPRNSNFAHVGASEENGQWPPHLHFQLITDMLGREGDFFGVAPPSQKEYFMKLCPDPGLILKIE